MRAVIFAALIAASSVQAQEAPRRPALASTNGRFVLGQIGDYVSSQYLIDTFTGRVWEVVNMTDSKGNTTGSALRQVKFLTPEWVTWGTEPPPANK